MATFSVIVRTKNEEKYINRCLTSIRMQEKVDDVEIILVDNDSTDSTVTLAEAQCDKVISIKDFLPGKAINLGVAQAKNDFIALISGHCIPQTQFWLHALSQPFLVEGPNRDRIVGVYGRQIPEKSSSALDKRDLWNTFRDEDRLQAKDVFFHNANSLIRREFLQSFPFDDKVSNVEDRIWAKQVISRGYYLYYAAGAVVSHWHGINHAGNIERAEKVVKVLEENGVYSESQEIRF